MSAPAAQPGWYPVDPHTERWWDGQQWGPQARPRQSPPPAMLRQPFGQPAPMQQPVMQHGRMVTTAPRRTSHAFHLLMTIFTCGLWGFVWLAMIIINSMNKERHVTRY